MEDLEYGTPGKGQTMLYPWQEELLKSIMTIPEGKVMFVGLPLGYSKTHVMEEFMRASVETERPNVDRLQVWIDEPANWPEIMDNFDTLMGQADGRIVIDSASLVKEALLEWKLKTYEMIQSHVKDMVAEVNEQLFPEKPYLAMNDWRKNRGGKRNR